MSGQNPITQFHRWLNEARAAKSGEPTAMALATINQAGEPEVRMVLLKHADAEGFVFYTNLESPKAAALGSRPVAELCFYWNPPGRQVRIHGTVTPVSGAEADAYFASRPYRSRLGAWASRQSRPLPGRFALLRAVGRMALRYAGGTVPRPPHWGGFRVRPETVEFWEEKPYRLHERVLHRLGADGVWTTEPLYP